MKVAMKGGDNPVTVTCTNFVKGLLTMLWFHVPTAVRVLVSVNGHMQAEYNELTLCLSLTTLALKPCALLLGDETIMRIGMCIAQQHKADAAMDKRAVCWVSKVLFK